MVDRRVGIPWQSRNIDAFHSILEGQAQYSTKSGSTNDKRAFFFDIRSWNSGLEGGLYSAIGQCIFVFADCFGRGLKTSKCKSPASKCRLCCLTLTERALPVWQWQFEATSYSGAGDAAIKSFLLDVAVDLSRRPFSTIQVKRMQNELLTLWKLHQVAWELLKLFETEVGRCWKLLRFRKLGINIDNIEAEELWEILDADHSGEIDEDFWITGTHCLRRLRVTLSESEFKRKMGKLENALIIGFRFFDSPCWTRYFPFPFGEVSALVHPLCRKNLPKAGLQSWPDTSRYPMPCVSK